uniref:PUM-HD domain-containing protein n=1 Tax=Oryza glaberrima TaxID=4538 RepID=I1PJS7_ORYGL
MENAAGGRRAQQTQVTEERQKKMKHKAAQEIADGSSTSDTVHGAADGVCFPCGTSTATAHLLQPKHSQPQHEGYNSSYQKVLANADMDRDSNSSTMQTQVPTNTREGPTFTQLVLGDEDFDLPPYFPEAEENNQFYQQTMNENLNMNQLGNNGIETAELEPQEHIMTFASSFGVGSQLLGSQAIEVVDVVGGLTSQWGTQLHGGHLARVISYIRAFHDPNQQILSNLVMHQSIETMWNHYAQTAEMSYSMRYPENAVTRGPQNVSGFPQTNGQINTLNNMNSEFHFLLEQAKNPENNSMRLINIRGHLSAFSIDPLGSRFIQHKLERATPAELAMVYEEIVPHAHMLAIDVFANYVVQKVFPNGN